MVMREVGQRRRKADLRAVAADGYFTVTRRATAAAGAVSIASPARLPTTNALEDSQDRRER